MPKIKKCNAEKENIVQLLYLLETQKQNLESCTEINS